MTRELLSFLFFDALETECFQVQNECVDNPRKLGQRLFVMAYTSKHWQQLVEIYAQYLPQDSGLHTRLKYSVVPVMLSQSGDVKMAIEIACRRFGDLTSPKKFVEGRFLTFDVSYTCVSRYSKLKIALINELAYQTVRKFDLHHSDWTLEKALKRLDEYADSKKIPTSKEVKRLLNNRDWLFRQISLTCFGHPKHDEDIRGLSYNEGTDSPAAKYLLKLGSARLLVILKVNRFGKLLPKFQVVISVNLNFS